MDNILNYMSNLIINNMWIAPLMAFLAGILTSFMPCSLTSVPLVIGYVSSYDKESKKTFGLSVVFAIGMAVTFTVLGAVASLLGKYIRGGGSWWYLLLGTIMVLMALQTYEIFTFVSPKIFKTERRGYIGAFLMGILGGFFSSPCSTPVLITLLALVANSGNLFWGMFLLLMYAIGNSFLVIALGTSVGLVNKIKNNDKYDVFYIVSKYVLGTIVLLIGFYMFYLGF